MYSEANRDEPDFEHHFWEWLFNQTAPSQSSKLNLSDLPDHGTTTAEYLEWNEPHSFSDPQIDPTKNKELLRIGELPTVQDRFYALLKTKIRKEVENRPPLFPWELASGQMAEYVDDAQPLSLGNLWWPQWQTMNLPLPSSVFAELLKACQTVIQTSWREGTKLVQAVETLFPGQSLLLNEMAGRVLMGEARSPETLTLDYEMATPTQQMALSLLAAQRLISLLTLNCPLNEPMERQWLTAVGLLTLKLQYQLVPSQGMKSLRIEANLPIGGSLLIKDIHSDELYAKSERSTAGYLSVELFDPHPQTNYILKVSLLEQDQEDLTFSICPTEFGA